MSLAKLSKRHLASKEVDLSPHTAVILSFHIQFLRQEYSTGVVDAYPQLHII